MKLRQQGISIMETVGALAIGSVMALGVSSMIDTSLSDLQGQQASLHQAQIVEAARKYVIQNYETLAAVSGVQAITVAALTAGKFLPGGFSNTNAFGQSTCVLVLGSGDISSPISALVVTYGGTPIPDLSLAVVAAAAGQGGGYITNDGKKAKGSSWELSTTDYQKKECGSGDHVLTGLEKDAGHLASLIYVYADTAAGDFLYRSPVPNRPELNTMRTPIRMAGSAIASEGAPCSGPGIAVDASGVLVSCVDDGTGTRSWASSASSWKTPVNDYADLPTTAAAGEVRVVLGGINRAFTYDGTGWVALAVDQNGDLVVPGDASIGNSLDVASGTISTGSLAVNGSITASGDIMTNGNLTVGNDILANQLEIEGTLDTQYVTVQEAVRVVGSLQVSKGLSVGYFGFNNPTTLPTKNVGQLCNEKGQIVPNATWSRLLICDGQKYQ